MGRYGALLDCRDCGATFRDRRLAPGEALRCGRCGAIVRNERGPHAFQALWAMATAGLILAVLANVEPILVFDVAGNTQSNRIVTGVRGLVGQGFAPVAALVALGAIIAPVLHLTGVWYVASACCIGASWPGLRAAMRVVERMEPWNLVPVFAVAVLVAVVKLDMLGQVEWRQGAFWVLLLSLCSLMTAQTFDRLAVTRRLDQLR
jgi:paraquat-inducible protein A